MNGKSSVSHGVKFILIFWHFNDLFIWWVAKHLFSFIKEEEKKNMSQFLSISFWLRQKRYKLEMENKKPNRHHSCGKFLLLKYSLINLIN